MFACAVLDEIQGVVEAPSVENQRASIALSSLHQLQHIDAYIKLDNSPLRDQIRNILHAQASVTGSMEFSRLKVRFARQLVALEASMEISIGPGETINAALTGDVILTFSGNQLIWLPHFNQLNVSDSNFIFENTPYPAATKELEEQLLVQANREIADAVIVLGKNHVQIDPLPLGEIEVGAALTNFDSISSTNSRELGGVFIVAGSSILIEPRLTSIALDLQFIPNFSDCPSDVYVSRSTFAQEIKDREPVGVTRFFDLGEGESHFFTEISGATRSTAVVHYWYADGQPVALEELPVEPSFRWRTWSSKRLDRSLARNWEVIVVEKETGCILHSQAIRTDPAIKLDMPELAPAQETYEQFRAEFERRVSEFSILEDRPDIALIEVPRPFLNEVLHASVKDLEMVVNLDINQLPTQSLSGSLQPFNADQIFCEERECSAQRECASGFSQCMRHHDTRDCTTCLFRNMLNNRCITEGVDPICEAARTTQNSRYESERESCAELETRTNSNCQRLRTQELRSCEIEAASEQSACESGRETVQEFSASGSFAEIALKLDTSGGLSAIFSDFAIEGDLTNIRLKLGFSAALDLTGSIRFAPRQTLGSLASCMNAWQSSFQGKVVLPQLSTSMIGQIKTTESRLTTDWSGYVITASIKPTPLESMFVDNPNLLADCQIGLTVDKVAEAIDGANRDYLSGAYPFEIQPLQSQINLSKASVSYGELMFEAAPELSPSHLKYDVKK